MFTHKQATVEFKTISAIIYLIIIIIIICLDFLRASRRGSHVESDYAHKITKNTPHSPYNSHLRLDLQ